MKTTVVLLAALAAGVFAAEVSVTDLVVVPKLDSAGVYRNETRGVFETPLFKASREDRLLVVATEGDRYLVKDREGRQGWIAKSACARLPRGTQWTFEAATIESSWNMGGFGRVEGNSDFVEMQIELDRSFADELRVNSDQEQISRMAGK